MPARLLDRRIELTDVPGLAIAGHRAVGTRIAPPRAILRLTHVWPPGAAKIAAQPYAAGSNRRMATAWGVALRKPVLPTLMLPRLDADGIREAAREQAQ